MFARDIVNELVRWCKKKDRKPLVIRGARQVGKTTVIREFARNFEQFIYINLELPEDRKPFEEFSNFDTLLQSIFFLKDKALEKRQESLVFIDEIQEIPEALQQLRYFFEDAPDIPVIAAGSMLETLFNNKISFPVGRVEYLVIHPTSFPEFLGAMGESAALEQLKNVPIQNFAVEKLMRLYRTYCVIGGMPEVVAHYSKNRDLASLSSIYESLLVSYIDDVEKYASGNQQVDHIRHAIRSTFAEAGTRIKFQNFGNSVYKSREMGEALRALEKALLLHLIYPLTETVLPIRPNINRSPRLQILDTGMLNYYVGIQKEIIGTEDLSSVYKGTMIEHITGQELLARQYSALHNLHFWVRDKKGSSAEVDYVYQYNDKLVPIEVKSGATGKLRSLHIYMDEAPHNLAIRFYDGNVNITSPVTPNGKRFHLLNLPYCVVSQIQSYLEWFEQELR